MLGLADPVRLERVDDARPPSRGPRACPGCSSSAAPTSRRGRAGCRRRDRSCGDRRRSRAARFASTVSAPCVLQLVRADLVAEADAAALPGRGRRARRGPRGAIRASAASSCARQSQRRLPSTSPVKHDECTRVEHAVAGDIAEHHRDVLLVRRARPRVAPGPGRSPGPIHDHAKLAVRRRQPGLGVPREHRVGPCMAGAARLSTIRRSQARRC